MSAAIDSSAVTMEYAKKMDHVLVLLPKLSIVSNQPKVLNFLKSVINKTTLILVVSMPFLD